MIADKLMRTSVLIALMLILALFNGCRDRDKLVTDSDNGNEIRLRTGETLTVRLESNPTTGFRWQVMEIDDSVLGQEGEPEFKAAPGSGGLVGSGGEETIRFKALGTGKTTLTLGYLRPWEEVPPSQTFRIQVVVE